MRRQVDHVGIAWGDCAATILSPLPRLRAGICRKTLLTNISTILVFRRLTVPTEQLYYLRNSLQVFWCPLSGERP